MRIGGRNYKVDWGHLIVATTVAGLCSAYLLDARSTSRDIQNLLLVQPLALFALLMYLLILPQCFKPADAVEEEAAPPPQQPLGNDAAQLDRSNVLRVGVLAVALGLFVVSLNTIGFDVGIWLFSAVTMFICGERRPLPLLLYPTVLAVLLVYGFRALMPYPMVTTIL
jgi:type IV secretory pathway TrbD component